MRLPTRSIFRFDCWSISPSRRRRRGEPSRPAPRCSESAVRLALVHPVFWPEVRRGSERVLHDIGRGMAERGHEVTLLTSHPGPPTESVEDGMLVGRAHRPPPVPGMRLHELFLETVPQVIRGLSP